MSIPIDYPYIFFLLFSRFLAFMVTAPLFSQRTLPVLAKVGLAGLFAFLLTPVSPATPAPADVLTFFMLIAQEILVGLLLGFVVLLPILTIGLIGHYVANSMGLSYATSISPLFNDTAPPLGQFYRQLALLITIAVRADQVVILGLKRLVDLLPPGRFLSHSMLDANGVLVERLLFLTSQMWSISLQLALPAVGVILLADLALVLIGRAMPRMNAFSLSLPLKVLMGMLVTTLSFPYLWPQLLRVVDRSGQQMLMLFR